ncbi:hypothetical protein B0G73_102275 [Paraburkholderia sp. BL25I1N1]|nr:hypothetical protein B0G73_102275 [Paraburkholderia sp. BL25I1N1]
MFLPRARKQPQGARHLKSRIVPSWRHIRAGHADLRRWSRMNRGAGIRVGLSFHVLASPFRQNAERHDVVLRQVGWGRLHCAIIADASVSVANNLLVAFRHVLTICRHVACVRVFATLRQTAALFRRVRFSSVAHRSDEAVRPSNHSCRLGDGNRVSTSCAAAVAAGKSGEFPPRADQAFPWPRNVRQPACRSIARR